MISRAVEAAAAALLGFGVCVLMGGNPQAQHATPEAEPEVYEVIGPDMEPATYTNTTAGQSYEVLVAYLAGDITRAQMDAILEGIE